MQVSSWLILMVMTLALVQTQRPEGTNTNTADENQRAGTSYSSNVHDGAVFSTFSAYHRLRHQERQRRRQRVMHRIKDLEVNLNRQSSDEDGFRRQFINQSSKSEKRTGYNKESGRKRERNEALCKGVRSTVHMNTPLLEYDPPFVIEVRCKNVIEYERQLGRERLKAQSCVGGMLRCVQIYRDVHFSRRRVGSHSWHPYTLSNVPSGCECMWPVDKYGHQEL